DPYAVSLMRWNAFVAFKVTATAFNNEHRDYRSRLCAIGLRFARPDGLAGTTRFAFDSFTRLQGTVKRPPCAPRHAANPPCSPGNTPTLSASGRLPRARRPSGMAQLGSRQTGAGNGLQVRNGRKR